MSFPSSDIAAARASRVQRGRVGVDVLSGFASGIAVTIVGHPLETLKVRLQTQPSGAGAIYTGVVDCARKTLAWEGPAGFYRGVGAPLVGQLFMRTVLFSSNAAFSRWRADGRAALTPLEYALGGTVAWGVATAVECPLQLASSQIQVQAVRAKADAAYVPRFTGPFAFWGAALRERGLRGVYMGLAPHLARNALGGFFHFGAFEALRRAAARERGLAVERVGLATNLAAGSVGGILFWGLTYPLDVIKSALQTDDPDPARRKYRGAVDAARQLWAEGGVARYTRGFSACLLRAVPANAALLATATRVRELGYAYVDSAE